MITDNHGRKINYLRLAVTDRCNLRCFYCMPEEGIDWLNRAELLSYEEILRLCTLLVDMGIDKIRITGGEPFVRRDMMQLLEALSAIDGLNEISLTTNGVLTAPYIPELKRLGIKSINLSLDTLDAGRFFSITRRDEFAAVMHTLDELLKYGFEVKINAVVMDGRNTQDILPLVALTKDLPVSVRFIEEMPFNGDSHVYTGLAWDHLRILDHITQSYPGIQKIKDAPYSTSYNYHIPGHIGNVGIIAAYSRTFCGTCNRIRLTPQGEMKTCLYEGEGLDVRALLRSNASNDELRQQLATAISHRAKDGWEAEAARKTGDPVHESMALIGG
ncbi:GTP 3',8-cyclase MoaA [Mucilaginibacter mali]|uniref:GTP 3',8-cyclase n=1 Tax=Mucilaginibacter mali TaxID=2740462 RepID=A0A7D4UGB0_9SPHI|nr:GTP 3',8-cyclase MoaA [Mucilaginibacter mali]QKJ31536.1 GTP 3',8-cyclase MoaA [Mucilaginibacter mali]